MGERSFFLPYLQQLLDKAVGGRNTDWASNDRQQLLLVSRMETHTCFFSIIIPTFNRAHFIKRAINSILHQEFVDFEIIVVDDGSTDSTRKEVEQISIIESQLRYYYKINEERSIARNFGISKAQGMYVSFLDSDDILYPNHLKVAFELLRSNNFPEVGHLGFESRDEVGGLISQRNDLDEFFKKRLLKENILHGNAIFIRRDISQNINFIQHRAAIISEDWYVWLRLAARYKFYFNNTVTSCVNHHSQRSLNRIDVEKLRVCTSLIVHHLHHDPVFMLEFKWGARSHFADHYTLLTLHLALQKNRILVVRYLIIAMCWDIKVIFRKRFLASVKHLFL